MVSDRDLYVERHTRLKQIEKDAVAAGTLSLKYSLSLDSVRGRLSRADTPANRVAVMKAIAAEVPNTSPAVERQLAVIERSTARWEAHNHGDQTMVFMSDLHLGQPRWDAYYLALEICDHVQPNSITAMNDAIDNKGFGRWEEDRPVRGMGWTSDVENLRAVERAHYRNLSDIAEALPALAGNHDNWFHKHLRENAPQIAEQTIAVYMESLEEQGVLVFTRGYQENLLELSPAVVVWHGQYALKNVRSLAKANIEHVMQLYNDGIARSVVAGHTHRPYEEHGVNVGYPGVQFVSNGALTDYTPYLKRHPHAHGLGITVIEYDTESREHELTLVRFKERNDKLHAKYQGKQFSVPIDKSHRNDYL